MKNKNRPYFLWDYDLTDDQVRGILDGNNETEKLWMTARILSNANFNDVWRYLTLAQVVDIFPKLRMRPVIKDYWQRALAVWGYNVQAN